MFEDLNGWRWNYCAAFSIIRWVPICSKSKFERGWMVLNCPSCGKEMMQGKVCSSEALWWQDRENKHRLNDEGGILGRFNGDRITAYRCEKCKKIIIDEE